MTPFSSDRQAFRETLATLAAKTLTRIPALNGRVEKAVKLALAGDVELHDDGSATVRSASDPTRRYEIREGVCSCQDYARAPEHLCQHRLAAGLVRKAHELLPQDPAPDGIGNPDTTPLYEAPSSCNVYVMISGHKVQVTLRDNDEQRMLERLQVLLDRYPVPTPAAGPTQAHNELSPQQHNAAAMHRPVTGFCPVHNVAMRQNLGKDGRTWYSHYDETAGRWCKGK
jgi:hypothetical protein